MIRRVFEALSRALEGVGRAASAAVAGLPTPALLTMAAILAIGIRALAVAWNPPTPHEQHYLHDAQDVRAAGSVTALRGSVHGWGQALAYALVLEHWPRANLTTFRAIQLGFSLAVVGLVYAIGRSAASPRVGSAAALVMALTPQAAFYGASAEPYSSHLWLVTLLAVAYVWCGRRPSPSRYGLMGLIAAASAWHHFVAVVSIAALAGHALYSSRRKREKRSPMAVVLGLGLVLALPMALSGSPGHARNLIGAVIPYFFSVAVVGSLVVFLVLWDETASVFDPAWSELLPWLHVPLVLFWLPYCRLQYLLPCTVPMSLVLGAALVEGKRPRVVGALLLFVLGELLPEFAHAVGGG